MSLRILTYEEHNELVSLYKKGWKLKALSQRYGISITTVWTYVHRTPQPLTEVS